MIGQGEKITVQARAKETRNRLVAALVSLLKEKAYEDISVAEIAKRADVSVGSVYRRFENKDAFIPVVLDAYKTRLEVFAADPKNHFEPNAEKGLRAALREMARLAWRFLEEDGYLLRAVFIHARTHPHLVAEDWSLFLEDTVAVYMNVLSHFEDEIERDNLGEAARMTLYLLNIGMAEYGLYPTQGPAAAIKMSPDKFIEALSLSIYGYLTVSD